MDPTRFDTLTRAIAQSGTRRRLLALLAALPLSSMLTGLAADDAGAERPIDRVQGRTPQRNRQQRNNNGNNKNNNSNNRRRTRTTRAVASVAASVGSRAATAPRTATAARPTASTSPVRDKVRRCASRWHHHTMPPAGQGLRWDAVLLWRRSPATRVLPDRPPTSATRRARAVPRTARAARAAQTGCGAGGTCGSCPSGQTCNETTGQCQGSCTPQCQGKTCGPDGCGGSCGTCFSADTCQSGICCRPMNGTCCIVAPRSPGQCSATVPCCSPMPCQNGSCCIPSGFGCDRQPELCCSGACVNNACT